MKFRTRLPRTAAPGLAALTTAAALAVTTIPAAATGSAGPRFLSPSQLPPHASSPWYAGPVTAGRPDPLPMCVGESLPSTSSYREFWTELDTGARQVTVVERNNTRAKALATLWKKRIAGCADELMEQYPQLTAYGEHLGKVKVEEGADVYGVYSEHPESSADVNLLSVGRDGRTVTFVNWGQMGYAEDAPVKKFKKTTATAVAKLY